ncbi:hypothetical protein Vadar_029143 [Vaccinium darrowii]|uniref:Uncharacterized protein n=1 Tax=Vaccinium darrowii TaxID=229202 RepID=A0ACB7YZZ7_9ERIC|nr:hypothetical protein Vadar_029143 [Vaccinium darrowii]
MEEKVEKTKVDVPYRRTRSVSNAANTDFPLQKMKDDAHKESAGGKCLRIFSSEAHDKQGITMQMHKIMNVDLPSAPRSPNDSNCSNNGACLTEEKKTKACNNHGIPGMLFPTIYKKKRTEEGHCTTTSSMLPTVGPNSRIPAAQFKPSNISTKKYIAY